MPALTKNETRPTHWSNALGSIRPKRLAEPQPIIRWGRTTQAPVPDYDEPILERAWTVRTVNFQHGRPRRQVSKGLHTKRSRVDGACQPVPRGVGRLVQCRCRPAH